MKQWFIVLFAVLLAGCSAPVAQAPVQQGNAQPQGWIQFSPKAVASFKSVEGTTFELSWQQKNTVTLGIVNSGVRPSEFPLGKDWTDLVPGRLQCRYVNAKVDCQYNSAQMIRNY